MMRTFGLLLIFSGCVLMCITAVEYNRLLRNLRSQIQFPKYATRIKRILRGMMAFFIFGFFVGAADLLIRNVEPIYYFVVSVFFVGSAFVFLLVQHVSLLTKSNMEKTARLESALNQIEHHNEKLKEEVNRRVCEIVRQDDLLHTVNMVSGILLASDVNDFSDRVGQCMGMIASAVNMDRIEVCKNFDEDGKLFFRRIYKWTAAPFPENQNLSDDFSYDEALPNWKETLAAGKILSGRTRHLSGPEQLFCLHPYIDSVLMLPVFLEDYFWGFTGYFDFRRDRSFTGTEEKTLQSAGLLFATAVLRNEMMQNLIQAREAAISSARAKSDFLSNMSHEIRTPINAIIGMTAIARKSETVAAIHASLDKVDAASRQLLGIINDILDMSKIEAGKMELAHEPFDLFILMRNIRSIVEAQANAKRHHLSITTDPHVPRVVVGDEMRLAQIFLNLLSNAVKFTPEEGSIHVSLRVVDVSEGLHHFEAQVTDTGVGITEEQQARLFQAFTQADSGTAGKYGGTGLGLVISKRIAALMQGNITISSVPGEGSCFTVCFRLPEGTPEMLRDAGDHAEAAKDAFSGKKALLVEDIAVNREIMLALLEEWGITADCAENGEAAVKRFARTPKAYDFIVMDVYMPVMDGYEATGKIRALDIPEARTVPIIAMTANAFSDDVKRCLDAGMNAHIAKPVDLGKLYRILKKLLRT